MKNGTKFTGIFAFLVIKLLILLVLKVQTIATLEQEMMPMKNEHFRTVKKKHDHVVKNKFCYEKNKNNSSLFETTLAFRQIVKGRNCQIASYDPPN